LSAKRLSVLTIVVKIHQPSLLNMDSPGPLDEVISDSEGEMNDEEHPRNLGGSFITLSYNPL
jgi:hypothetical protein